MVFLTIAPTLQPQSILLLNYYDIFRDCFSTYSGYRPPQECKEEDSRYLLQGETMKENREEEPCHTTRVNLKYQVGLEITARVFKSVILRVTSQRRVTILAFSQVLNCLEKKCEVKIQDNDFFLLLDGWETKS